MVKFIGRCIMRWVLYALVWGLIWCTCNYVAPDMDPSTLAIGAIAGGVLAGAIGVIDTVIK